MTNYRLWPATNGPGLTSYSGPWTGAVSFAVHGGGYWFNGYYFWVPTGGDTAPSGGFNAALWSITGSTGPTGKLISGSTVTGYAGTVVANSWNFIPLATPIQLAPGWDQHSTTSGSAYLACVGWTAGAGHGFPDTNGYWGAGPGTNGITNGPLIGYSSNSGTSNKAPWGLAQGLFSSSSNNPASTMPIQVSGTDNFWVDVQVSDAAPASISSYRLWPNKADSNPATVGDAAVNYTIAIEISLARSCTLSNVWYFSPAASTTLATRADLWNVNTGLAVASITSPTWLTAAGGAASPGTGPGGQWIKAAFAANTVIPAGDYRVSVYNSAGSTDANWGPKDASTDYWGQTATNSVGAAGIAWGPLTAPGYSTAAAGFVFGGTGGDTPPWSTGGTVAAHAQPVFYQPAGSPTGAAGFPQLYASVGGGTQTQNYWVDLEVGSGVPQTATASLTVTPTLTATGTRGHSRTASLTVTPTLTASRTRGHSRTGSLTVTPTLAAARTLGHFRTASFTAVPSFTAARVRGHTRTGALTVTPALSATRTVAHVRHPSLTVTPVLSAVPHHANPANPVLFSFGDARWAWTFGAARNQ